LPGIVKKFATGTKLTAEPPSPALPGIELPVWENRFAPAGSYTSNRKDIRSVAAELKTLTLKFIFSELVKLLLGFPAWSVTKTLLISGTVPSEEAA
jgi:hypothetical protein